MLTLDTRTVPGSSYAQYVPMPHHTDMSRLVRLTDSDTDDVLAFLNRRPVHTVVMTSMIIDNGIESRLNRGEFYGYCGVNGEIEGIALIGHSTLVEARSDAALRALAHQARRSSTPIHLIMSADDDAAAFFHYYGKGTLLPRLSCTERLFQIGFPFPVQDCEWDVRNARPEEVEQIARAHAEVAFLESGIDPMARDREGFIQRVLRRIEQGRTFVVFEDGKLVFKADIIAEAADVIYLEGVYVGREFRGMGVGSSCLAKLCLDLLGRASNVCLLSNVDFTHAHRTFQKAGMESAGSCTTIFL